MPPKDFISLPTFNVIIADVDGVIKLPNQYEDNGWNKISILRLKSILVRCSGYLVVSSNWRLDEHSRKILTEKLESYGIQIYDYTADLRNPKRRDDYRDISLERWEELRTSEVAQWVTKNQMVAGKLMKNWVAIDDIRLALPRENFVQTDELIGISDKDAWRIENRANPFSFGNAGDLDWSRDGYEYPTWWDEYPYTAIQVGCGKVIDKTSD